LLNSIFLRMIIIFDPKKLSHDVLHKKEKLPGKNFLKPDFLIFLKILFLCHAKFFFYIFVQKWPILQFLRNLSSKMWFLRTKTWFFKNRQRIKKFVNCMLKNFTKIFFSKNKYFSRNLHFSIFFVRKCWFLWFFLVFGRFYGPVSPRNDVLFKIWLNQAKQGTLETILKKNIFSKVQKLQKLQLFEDGFV